jgi:hypothetical protein
VVSRWPKNSCERLGVERSQVAKRLPSASLSTEEVARGAAALRGDEERFATAEAMQGGKFTVEAVGQSAQFLAGVSTSPVDRLFVRVKLAPALGTGRRQVMRLAATS